MDRIAFVDRKEMMDSRGLIENTGASIPLAAQLVAVILESGASHVEIVAALNIVSSVLPTLPVSLTAERAV